MTAALIPDEFGLGWMSENARNLMKIAVYLGGFDPVTLAQALIRASKPGRILNCASVDRVLGEIRDGAR